MTRYEHAYVLNVVSDDHPGIVAAVGEYEGQLIVREQIDLVDRPPRCDMIGFGGNAEHWRPDVL